GGRRLAARYPEERQGEDGDAAKYRRPPEDQRDRGEHRRGRLGLRQRLRDRRVDRSRVRRQRRPGVGGPVVGGRGGVRPGRRGGGRRVAVDDGERRGGVEVGGAA